MSRAVITSDRPQAPARVDLDAFTQLLNRQPKPEEIQELNGAKYIPIGIIEAKLDECFGGLWQTRNFQAQVIANEVTGSLELGVYHPVLGEWIWKVGTAAVMIQQDAWAKDPDTGEYLLDERGKRIKRRPLPTDVDAKIINTLEKDYPHLSSECIKNASKRYGAYFGRDLNRDFDKVGDVSSLETAIAAQEKVADRARQAIAAATTIKELGDIYSMYAKVPGIANMIKERRKQIVDGNEGA